MEPTLALKNTTGVIFPELQPRAKAVLADIVPKHAELSRRDKNLKLWQYVFGIVLAISLLIGLAVGVNLNEGLLSNTRDELTTADWVLRIAAALAMEVSLMAAGLGIHTAISKNISMGKRFLGTLTGATLLAGVILIAGAVGYGKFSSQVDTLWQGAGANTQNFDPSAETAPSQGAPIFVRLATSALFIGTGILAAFAEFGWLHVTAKRDEIRATLAKYQPVLEIHGKYEKARDDFLNAQEKALTLQDPSYRKAIAHSRVFDGIQQFRNATEARRPKPVNPAYISKSDWVRHQAEAAKVDQELAQIDEVVGKREQIFQAIGRIFPT